MDTARMDGGTERRETQRNEHVQVGLTLVGIGGVFLLARLLGEEWLILPLLGAGFLLAGLLQREAGWLIPGGVLSGIALGTYLSEGPWRLARGDAEGGLFLLGFAAGWFSIWVLSALFTPETQWWPLIPGGIMAFIGLSVLGGGVWLSILGFVGSLWPVGLVAGGAYLLIRSKRRPW